MKISTGKTWSANKEKKIIVSKFTRSKYIHHSINIFIKPFSPGWRYEIEISWKNKNKSAIY